MLTQTHAVVLHSFKFGDSKLIVDLFTEIYGRISFITSVAKNKRSTQTRMLFQPLTLLEVSFDYRPTQNLQKLKEVRVLQPLHHLSTNPFKCAIALFVAEFLYYATKKEENNTLLYKYIETSVLWLDHAQEGFANFHLVFTAKMSKFIGFYPNVDGFYPGCIFNLRTACFERFMPTHADALSSYDTQNMYTLLRLNYETMRFFTISHTERNRATNIILRYYQLHLPSFPTLKSLAVIQDVMRG